MSRILISTDSYLPRLDGVSIFLSEISQGLSEKHEVTILGPRYKNEPPQKGHVKTRLIQTYNFKIGEFELAKIKLGIIKRAVHDCDILFNQSIGTIGYFAAREAIKQKKKVIGFVHSIEHMRIPLYISFLKRFSYWFLKKIEKRYYESCDLLLVPSEITLQALEDLGVRTKMMRIELGVDTQKFAPSDDKASSKKKIGIEPHIKIIGYVGRVSREKNLTVLYDAFKRLEENTENIKLLIVGSGLRKEFFPDTKNIIFVNSTSNVEDYYKAMDVFVMPSFIETTSLATMEAMSCGIPTVATKVGTIPSYLKHGVNGYFFPKEHDKALAEKIKAILNDKKLAETMSKNARETITTNFSWKRTIMEILEAIDSL